MTIQTMLASPVAHFESLLWLWDGPSNREIGTGVTPVTILSRILRALEECRRDDRVPKAVAKRINTRARAVLAARNYKGFVACLDTIEGGMATALRTHISKLDNLGRVVREDLLSHLNRRFPLPETRRQVEPWAREDCIFVTATGMARKQEQIEQHVNVKMRKNAQAIGKAAEKGDLSENSEYKFALEERDLLRARLAQMQAQVAQSQVMVADEVPTDHIGVGSRAICRHLETGATVELTFLGPWEADVEQHIYNYKAPLAQALMGLKVGEKVELTLANPPGQHQIEKIENALA
ncbi:MAG: GreA/GreB family elongation factor [Planctomycetes bacterium]|nr:GreA/GreB family elongation factor [Planctomycetota bacterium]